MESAFYNSRDSFYKSKFGAVAEDEKILLRVLLPRSFMCNAVTLYIRRDDEEQFSAKSMYWAGMYGSDREIWDIEISLKKSGIYWYHFTLSSAWGDRELYNDRNSVGIFPKPDEEKIDWQLTVYAKKFKTPDWLKGGIIYQIFPDRFYFSGRKKKNVPEDRILRDDRKNLPYWRPDAEGKVLNNDYFCGDLKGIEQRLPYLEKLSVSCIYLNPIFEAHSNHRYNTANYLNIDPLLGTQADFVSLCNAAHKRGIRIILDGVFSHTGDDSIYFNKYKRYGDGGAYNSKKSPYYKWYDFWDYPDKYRSWWGFETLPEVNEERKEYLEFITGKGGVIEKWLKLGADGWRLDVADELPDVFIDAVRRAVKRVKPDALLLGEVWEDATTKFSYGSRRKFLLGKQFDSIMNYPFANSVIKFVREGHAEDFAKEIIEIAENYPAQALNVMMNHIGTHDTQRAITGLVAESPENRDRAWQEAHHLLKSKDYLKGVKLLKLASAIQYMLPGVPSVYYGDEIGMQGYKDPFNRCFFDWDNINYELLGHYEKLGKIRKSSSCLVDGRINFVSSVLGCTAFERRGRGEAMLIIANRNEEDITYNLPAEWQFSEELLAGEAVSQSVTVKAMSAVILRRSFER